MENDILSEVKKPLTERYWPWRVDTNGEWFRQRGNEQVRVSSEDHAKEAQALEDEPLLIARLEALEAVIELFRECNNKSGRAMDELEEKLGKLTWQPLPSPPDRAQERGSE